jgi:hypothetical protein
VTFRRWWLDKAPESKPWKGRSGSPVLTADSSRNLDLLRTRGLSIENLDYGTRSKLREFLFHLHHERGVSLSDIAGMIGSKISGYTSWVCKSLGVPARPFEE